LRFAFFQYIIIWAVDGINIKKDVIRKINKKYIEGFVLNPYNKMGAFKNNMSLEEAADEVLRDYLVRCHHIISKDYQKIKDMKPENAANFLMHLRKTGKISIKLKCIDNRIHCKIIEKNR